MSRRRLGTFAGVLVAMAIGVAACGAPLSHVAQINAWSNEEGYSALDQVLVADFPNVAAGISSGKLRALKTACDGLSIDAGNVYDTLITPDRSLTNMLATALNGLSNAAVKCNALSVDTPSATVALRRELAKNEALYGRARTIINNDAKVK